MCAKDSELTCSNVLGAEAVPAMRRAADFLAERGTGDLTAWVGRTLPELALAKPAADKRRFPASYGGGKPCGDDLLAGRGMFYVTESGKVMLDATAGHYQMTWGYNHPELIGAVEEATRLGIVWDNHSNIPSLPVKLLAEKLVEIAGPGFDRVLLGVCTGSVAAGAALKLLLLRHGRRKERAPGTPVMIVLAGNYHGTEVATQAMRGMWPGLVTGMEMIQVEPNDTDSLEKAFRQAGGRLAGFWAEPVMMNREALELDIRFLQRARDLCTQSGTLMVFDEIQTGFWYPEGLMFRRLGVTPDIVVIGKGLTAGFHPLAGLLYRTDLDILEQYDAISTNGNASLAAYIALCALRLLDREGAHLESLMQRHHQGLLRLAGEFPKVIERVNGAGFLTGIKFRDREDALGFHKAAVARGLWLRVHAYHPGHRTVLAKYALCADETTVDFVLDSIRELLEDSSWQRQPSASA